FTYNVPRSQAGRTPRIESKSYVSSTASNKKQFSICGARSTAGAVVAVVIVPSRQIGTLAIERVRARGLRQSGCGPRRHASAATPSGQYGVASTTECGGQIP